MKHILDNGSCWPLEELPTADRLNDLEEALTFRNHKVAEQNPKVLKELVEKRRDTWLWPRPSFGKIKKNTRHTAGTNECHETKFN